MIITCRCCLYTQNREAFKFNEGNYFSTSSYMGWALGAYRRNKLDYKRIPLFGCNFDYLTICPKLARNMVRILLVRHPPPLS